MVYLHYGPSAQSAALEQALREGDPVHDPLGLEGLKTEEARLAVSLLSTSPIGDAKGVLVIGPMDQANGKASDVLLKKVEEPTLVLPILWARDLEEVRPTIRSRCYLNWCPGESSYAEEDLDLADHFLDSLLTRNMADAYRDLKDAKSDLTQVLRVVVARLVDRIEEDVDFLTRLWTSLRREMAYKRVTRLGVWAACLEVCDE